MATVDDIRRGLAANLRTLKNVNVSPYPTVNVTSPSLNISGVREVDYVQDMGPGAMLTFELEGATGSQSLKAGVQRFDKWVSPAGDDSVRQAVEADQKLTSRLKDDGKTLLTGQESAAAAVQLRGFEGYRREQLDAGGEALIGVWTVEVLL